jgi:hypothetical protein
MSRRAKRLILTGVVAGCAWLVLGDVVSAYACPMCREAVNQSAINAGDAAGPDGRGLGAAFAWSIYIMIAVPYLMVSVGGFVIWRAIKRAQAAQSATPMRVARQTN